MSEFLQCYPADKLGYGYHGDFMMGWDEDFLQQAVNTCTNLSGEIQDCPLFNIQSDNDAAQCTLDTPDDLKNDNSEGPRNGLAINVPIQPGPGLATSYPVVLANDATYMPALTKQPIKTTGLVPTLTYSAATETTIGVTDGMTNTKSPTAATLVSDGHAVSTLTTASVVGVTTVPAGKSAGPEPVVLSTSTITKPNGDILELVIEQVVVTVTGTGTPPPSAATSPATSAPFYGNIHVGPDGSVYTDEMKRKRDAHAHAHARRHSQRIHKLW